jgi:hypothetical protein
MDSLMQHAIFLADSAERFLNKSEFFLKTISFYLIHCENEENPSSDEIDYAGSSHS